MKSVTVALGLIEREGRWFLQRRDPAAQVFPGLWEFPGGKVEAGENAEAALRRELREELGFEADRIEALDALSHAYEDLAVTFHPYICGGSQTPFTRLAWGWFTCGEMLALRSPEATRRLLLQSQILNRKS